MEGIPGTIYLIHFDQPFGHARHYIGWARNLDARLDHHRRGTGANLIKHVNNAGITWRVARVWENRDRNYERTLKQRGHTRKCPICKAEAPDADTPESLQHRAAA